MVADWSVWAGGMGGGFACHVAGVSGDIDGSSLCFWRLATVCDCMGAAVSGLLGRGWYRLSQPHRWFGCFLFGVITS